MYRVYDMFGVVYARNTNDWYDSYRAVYVYYSYPIRKVHGYVWIEIRSRGEVEIPVLTERVYTRSEIGPRASRGRKRIVKQMVKRSVSS